MMKAKQQYIIQNYEDLMFKLLIIIFKIRFAVLKEMFIELLNKFIIFELLYLRAKSSTFLTMN